MKIQTLGIGAMAFGGTLAARAAVWLVASIRHPDPRGWPTAAMGVVLIVGVVTVVAGTRWYHRSPVAD